MQIFAGVKIIRRAECRLGGGAEHYGHAVMRHQQIEHIENRLQKLWRQLLRFVQHDDAIDQVMQLATA